MYFPQLSPRFRALLASISGQPVAVVGHARPDGDCIGSQVALARVLRALGHAVVCVNADPVPRRLQYLIAPDAPFSRPDDLPPAPGHAARPSASGPLSRRQPPDENGSPESGNPWQAVFVDCADHERGGAKARLRFPAPAGCIDHHLSNASYAAHNIVAPDAAATCEMLAGIFLDLGLPIDGTTAKALYAGINTDTGQFRFGGATALTFGLAARLVALGASPAETGYEIYERESWGKLKLLQAFLGTLRLECGGRACIGVLPDGIFEKTGATAEDTEGLVDYARCIDGVEIGVLIEERPGALKASLRAKNPALRVDRIAARFGGGGHACAAGLNLKKAPPPAEFRAQLLDAIAGQFAALEVRH